MGFKTLMVVPLVLIGTVPAHSQDNNDVYNFYFQKGSAPQSVVQGGGGQQAVAPTTPVPPPELPPAAPAAPVNNAVVAKVEEPKPPEAKRDYKTVELHLGPTRWRDEVGDATAYSGGIQLNFNRYIGTRLQAQYLAKESADYNRPVADPHQSSNRWGGSAALVFTPLRMDFVGHSLLRIGALAGLRSERRFANPTSQTIKTHIGGFVGASAGVNLNENVSIEGSVAMADGGKIAQGTGSLVFSF